MHEADHLLIFGASARAAAFSALRAGLRPWCADLFADADLRGRCPAMRVPGRYPKCLVQLVQTDVCGPWMYTGGLENHPGLIRRMERHRRLLGNGMSVLTRIRDPEVLSWAAQSAGLPAPRVVWRCHPAPSGRWLVKPIAGSGGSGIHFLGEARSRTRDEVYLQQHIEGDSAAALYVAGGGTARLLGLSRQLVGEDFLHAPPFRYCGSVGPLVIAPGLREGLVRLGNELARQTGARGLFGVDGILREGAFWPVEVNPRYTASVEVLEHALGLRTLDYHLRACEGALLWEGESPPFAGARVAKAILYARAGGVFPREGPWRDTLEHPVSVEELPAFADLPHEGDRLEAGRPVLTLFVRGETVDECMVALRHRAAEVERWLYP
jgi:predicted ATP-grasp superfamily ATP-dependent carboligase